MRMQLCCSSRRIRAENGGTAAGLIYGRAYQSKTQENTGICWTFAMASLESVMMTAGTVSSSINLSERQLAYFTLHGQNKDRDKSKYAGNDSFLNRSGESDYTIGGSRWFSVPTLTRWYGPVDESVLRSVRYGLLIRQKSIRRNLISILKMHCICRRLI